jgi:hypothetical protein
MTNSLLPKLHSFPQNLPLEGAVHQVRSRANYLCEFCHANERWQYVRFNVDHFKLVINFEIFLFRSIARSNKLMAVTIEVGC